VIAAGHHLNARGTDRQIDVPEDTENLHEFLTH